MRAAQVTTARVNVRDTGATALEARLRRATGARVRVGVLEEATKTESGEGETRAPLTLLEVAALHEFGAPGAGIPQRSFIRAGVDENLERIQTIQRTLGRQVLGGIELPVALDRLGAKVAAMLQNRISAGIEPPNSPETIERKGSSKPLVDTGQLKASITWLVVPG